MVYCGKEAVKTENNKPVYANKKELKEIKECFGLVFQNFNLFPHYSVLKNLMDAPVTVMKRNTEEVKKAIFVLSGKWLETMDRTLVQNRFLFS